MVLPEAVEKRFQRIEREYAARDRLAHHGLREAQVETEVEQQIEI